MENKYIERMNETNGVLQQIVDTYSDDARAMRARADEEAVGDSQADIDVARRFELFEKYLENQKAEYTRWADFWPKVVVQTGEAIDTAQARLQQLLDDSIALISTHAEPETIVQQAANITVLNALVQDIHTIRENYSNGFEAFLPAYVVEDTDIPELDDIMETLAKQLTTWDDGITRVTDRAGDHERTVENIHAEVIRTFG